MVTLCIFAFAASAFSATGKQVSSRSGDETVSAMLYTPSGKGPFPALIAIHAVGGLDEWVKQQASNLADAGYLTLAVDLYRGRVASGSADKMSEAREIARSVPTGPRDRDLLAAFNFLLTRPNVIKDHIGAIGWYMGGTSAIRFASLEPRLEVAVAHYPTGVPQDSATLSKINARCCLFLGWKDTIFPVENGRNFAKQMKSLGKNVVTVIYQDAGHAFEMPWSSQGYRTADSAEAWKQTIGFLNQTAMAGPGLSAKDSGPETECNAAAQSPLFTVTLPGHPFSIISTHDGCWLFVSLTSDDPKSNGVAVLRRTAGTISLQRVYPVEARKGRNPLRPGPSGMVTTHDGQLLVAANDDDLVFLDVKSMISGKAEAIAGHLSDGAPKHTVTTSNGVTETSAGSIYVNVTKDDARLFVSDEYAETISVIDLAKARLNNYDSTAIVGRIPTGVAPIALTFSPDEQWLYTTSSLASPSWNWPVACPQDRADRAAYTKLEKPEGAVVVVDVSRARTDPAHSVAAKAPAGCGSVRLAIAPDGGSIWVSDRRSDAVLGFDTRKLLNDPLHARLGLVPLGTAPVGIAALPDGKHIVVANSNRIAANPNSPQTVSVIEIEKVRAGAPAVIGTIPAGAFPREFSLSPDGHTLFLGNYLSNTIEVIDIRRLFDIVQTPDRARATIAPRANPDLVHGNPSH